MTELTIEEGKTLAIKYIGPGDANDDGTRNMIFELNGAKREVSVLDKALETVAAAAVMADPDNQLEIGSNLPGCVSKVLVREGEAVEKNQALAVIEAMKMETSVVANQRGLVDKILVKEGQSVKAGELLLRMK